MMREIGMGFIEKALLKERSRFETEFAERGSAPVPEDVVESHGVPYGPGDLHTMDIYRPRDAEDALPIIINIHGGGLSCGSKEFNRTYCEKLCRQGFVVFSADYRLVPEHSFMDQLDDVSRAMDNVRSVAEEHGGDPSDICMVADSAGALLTIYAVAMTRSPELAEAFGVEPSGITVRALGLLSGMFYMDRRDKVGLFLPKTVYGKGYKNGPFARFIDPECPEVAGNLPPSFLVTSDGDFLRRYTTDYAAALEKKGMDTFLDEYRCKLPHAFGVFIPEAEETDRSIERMARFLRSQ